MIDVRGQLDVRRRTPGWVWVAALVTGPLAGLQVADLGYPPFGSVVAAVVVFWTIVVLGRESSDKD